MLTTIWLLSSLGQPTSLMHSLLESLISGLDVYLFLSGGAGRETFFWRADTRPDTRQEKVSACKP